MIQTGALRSVDLHDRRLLIYSTQTGPNTHTLSLSLEPFRPNATASGNFAAGSTLLDKQVLTANLTIADDQAPGTPLYCKMTYERHQAVSRSVATSTDHWTPFLGFSEVLELIDQRPLRKGDMAALVLNYGRVTPSMLQLQTKKYWTVQQQQLQPSPPAVSIEDSAGLPVYLMGMSYYANVSQSQQQLFGLTKTNMVSFFAHGFSKLGAERTSTGILPGNGTINLIYPKVDMSFQQVAYASNGTLHPDLGQ